ncbi:MAG: hypothetical protein M3P95_06100 [Actinomycetota bacterium]|nr:hypothetical protein [Actinomycetota bacterium]
MTRRQILASGTAGAAALVVGGLLRSGVDDRNAAAVPLVDRAVFGAYADNEPWPDVQAHYDLEGAVGGRLPVMSWFQDWGPGWLERQAADAAASGHSLVIAWEPSRDGRPIPFPDILNGRYDDYVRGFFAGAAAHPRPVVVRPFWEMNGNWAAYSVASPNRAVTSVDEWKATWQHVVRLQREVAANTQMMFCANGSDVGGVPVEAYWPGVEWVDRLGLDTYNGQHGPWRDPAALIAPMYRRLTALHPRAPVALAEIGCREARHGEGQSKADWLRQLFTERGFSRVDSVLWFHSDKEEDWRLTSSQQALHVSQQYLGRP